MGEYGCAEQEEHYTGNKGAHFPYIDSSKEVKSL
jgi:hypothetical protein